MARSPRILHIAQPSRGGVVGYVEGLARYQSDHGWLVHCAVPRSSSLWDSTELGSHVTLVEWKSSRSPSASVLKELIALRRIVRDVRPDVVHLHSAKAGLVGRLLLRGRLTTIFQPHAWSWQASTGLLYRFAVTWERLGRRWTGLTICVSQSEQDEAVAKLGAAALQRSRVVRNGVDLERYQPSPHPKCDLKAALGLDPEADVVLCVGRLNYQKGQDILIRSWQEVYRRCSRVQLVLVGQTELVKPELYAGRDLGVVFAGEQGNVAEWLRAADVVAAPSRWEGMPLSLLEALACGACVLASDIAPHREIILEGGGRLVPGFEEDVWARELIELLDDVKARQVLGEEARFLVGKYDMATAMSSVTALTEDLERTT